MVHPATTAAATATAAYTMQLQSVCLMRVIQTHVHKRACARIVA
jgi:hypothetical protein